MWVIGEEDRSSGLGGCRTDDLKNDATTVLVKVDGSVMCFPLESGIGPAPCRVVGAHSGEPLPDGTTVRVLHRTRGIAEPAEETTVDFAGTERSPPGSLQRFHPVATARLRLDPAHQCLSAASGRRGAADQLAVDAGQPARPGLRLFGRRVHDALSLHFSQNVRECRWVQAVSRPVEQRQSGRNKSFFASVQ